MTMSETAILFLLIVFMAELTNGARILGMFPAPMKSHTVMNRALMKDLAKRGHYVTEVTAHPEKRPIPNYKELGVNVTMNVVKDSVGVRTGYEMSDITLVTQILAHAVACNALCEVILSDETIQTLIHSTDLQYDLIIMAAVPSECLMGFAHKFKAPVVQLCTFEGTTWMGDWVGNPNPLSYVPGSFQSFSDKMTFLERVKNVLGEIFLKIVRELYFVPQQNAIMKKHFNYTSEMPHLSDLMTSTSLVLINSHFSTSFPRPLVPNMVQVGGLHVETPKKLPEDLQKYLDEAQHGAIYFSMGSILQGSLMPESKRQAFLEAFSKLKQKVLWKWETDTLPGQPSNVKLGKWLPQSDILAHPNIRIFITHGGLFGAQEALHRGVPVIGVPIAGDQKMNVARAVAAGYGLLMDFNNITADSLTWAINEILENSRYRENSQRIARLFQDQPLTPLEQAVFWTEYVIRHKGAHHMRSAALDLSWYQYFLLDVIAVLALAAGSVLLFIIFTIKTMYKMCCASRKNKVSKAKKTK